MSTIALCLWFDGQAEAAANFYVETFRACGQPADIRKMARFGESGPGPKASVLTVAFVIGGQEMLALNGGPHFSFTPATSLMVQCADQAEIDRFWEKLSEGGSPGQCGWLTDRFGVSWQVVPTCIGAMIADASMEQRDRVMRALMQMTKLDLAALQRAHAGTG